MWISWFIFGFIMIATNRWFSYLTNKTGYIHAFFGWAILGLNTYAWITVVVANNGFDFTGGPHQEIGWIVQIGLVFFTLTGLASMMAKKLLKW